MFSRFRLQSRILTSFSKEYSLVKPSPSQKVIMLCGAPGVGKGTYSKLLADDFGYVKVSTGDEIRRILNGESQLSPAIIKEIKTNVSAGKLVPDEIIMEILFHQISQPEASKGIILDGFPRTVNQLIMFQQVVPINLAVNFLYNLDYLKASILGRRVCLKCGASYSAFSYYKNGYELDVQMPKKEGICDHCGGVVSIREDDTEEVLLSRLEEYHKKTAPLIEKLNEDGLVIDLEAKRGVRDYPQLQQMIVSRVGLPCHTEEYWTSDHNLIWTSKAPYAPKHRPSLVI